MWMLRIVSSRFGRFQTAIFLLPFLSKIHFPSLQEPFSTFFLNANDNKFDNPERAFSGIGRSWRNCQRDTADVKVSPRRLGRPVTAERWLSIRPVCHQELTPEFYYLPEMFVNSNEYELGVRDDGVPVCDVELPVWAKKPEDFVRINRMVRDSRK